MHLRPYCSRLPRAALLLSLFWLSIGGLGPWPDIARGYADTAAGIAARQEPRATDTARPLPERLRHLARLGVDPWHAAGFRGQGIKVAILDSGFRGYRTFLGKGLPAQVTVHSFRSDGNLEAKDSQHGILCGEVVHALAPDAELLFANWGPDSPGQFLDAVRWAREQGAQVISCSVIFPGWSDGEGGGPIHQSLARLLGDGNRAGDLLCTASAGNTARRHWSGPFRDGGDGLHRWTPADTNNRLTPWGGEPVSVELCWQGSAAYELTVHDQKTAAIVARSRARQEKGLSSAVARFQPAPGHPYQVQVRLTSGPAVPFHCVALGGNLEYATARGSVCFPADGPEVLAIGAVDAQDRRMTYSSCGPNSPQPKPDLVAPVPFPSVCRGYPFGGTSAAAPQAAALAALCWSRHPDWTAGHVRSALCTSARDLGAPGHDWETGYGLVHLPELAVPAQAN